MFSILNAFLDYPSQYNNNRNPAPAPPKYVQTTYRPSTVTVQTQSTSTKNIGQQTYIKPSYEPSAPQYNPEYDEALVAQVSLLLFLFQFCIL